MGSSKASMADVIGDNDLLHEILLRLGLPAFLVRAADPKFLRRFRDRHPPSLLGFYVHDARYRRQQFVPVVSEAPQLHAAVSDPSAGLPVDCRNGRLLLKVVGESTTGHYLVRSRRKASSLSCRLRNCLLTGHLRPRSSAVKVHACCPGTAATALSSCTCYSAAAGSYRCKCMSCNLVESGVK
jgi:hypothetical protein